MSHPKARALVALMGLLAVRAEAVGAEAKKPAAVEDAVLKRLESRLPARWHLRRDEQRLIVEGETPLWEVFYNRINAPATWGQDARRQWEELKKTTPPRKGQLVFRLEPRWPAAKLQEALRQNEAISAQLSKKAPAPEGPSKAAWAEERAREAELEKKLVKLPCNTERFSLFLEEAHGLEGEMTVVFPEEAGRETWVVRELLMKELAPCAMSL